MGVKKRNLLNRNLCLQLEIWQLGVCVKKLKVCRDPTLALQTLQKVGSQPADDFLAIKHGSHVDYFLVIIT